MKKRVRYPGRLDKPTLKNVVLADALLEWGEPAGTRSKRWAERHVGLMLELLDHYKIPHDSPHAWLDLAYRLALDHVPAFTISTSRGRGRPRTRPFTPIADRKKPGPQSSELTAAIPSIAKWLPKFRDDERYRQWLAGRRDSKRAAVEYLLRLIAKRGDESESKLASAAHIKSVLNALARYERTRPRSSA